MFFVCLLRVNNISKKGEGITLVVSFQHDDNGKNSAFTAHFQWEYAIRVLHDAINYTQ